MTTTVEEKLDVLCTVRARDAAMAWLNVFLATGSDEERPLLNRTLCIEWSERGVQFIATDGTIMFRSWVPSVPSEDEPIQSEWPENDEAYLRSIVVMDTDCFGIGFMRTLLRVTGEDGHEYEPLTLSTSPHDDEANLALGSAFMSERLTLRACGQRIDLRLYDDKYPDWRRVQLGADDVQRIEGLTLAPRLLGLVGKVKGATAVDCDFSGDTRAVMLNVRGENRLKGLLMPMRRLDVAE